MPNFPQSSLEDPSSPSDTDTKTVPSYADQGQSDRPGPAQSPNPIPSTSPNPIGSPNPMTNSSFNRSRGIQGSSNMWKWRRSLKRNWLKWKLTWSGLIQRNPITSNGKSNKRTALIAVSVIGLIALLILAAVTIRIITTKSDNGSQSAVLGELQLNKLYTLPALNPADTTKRLGQMNMNILNAQKLSSVKVQGKAVEIPENKAFLSLNIELQNRTDANLGFFSRDYIRLIKDNKPYAPQFYNQGITVAPVSVKSDRVAFVIDKDAKEITLQVGDFSSKQTETVTLTFP